MDCYSALKQSNIYSEVEEQILVGSYSAIHVELLRREQKSQNVNACRNPAVVGILKKRKLV